MRNSGKRTKNARRVEYDDAKFVPPHDPLFSKGIVSVYKTGDLVLGLLPDLEHQDVVPRVGLVIDANCQCDVYGDDVTPGHHRVMWSCGEVEVNSEDDLAPVAHS
jgi:hypothetical protein